MSERVVTVRRGLGAVVLALSAAMVAPGCTALFDDGAAGPPEGILIQNETDQTLIVTYEVTEEQRAGAQVDEVRLPPGDEEPMVPTPTDGDRCLLAPIVARTAEGDEVDRLDEGHCIAEDTESPENRFAIR